MSAEGGNAPLTTARRKSSSKKKAVSKKRKSTNEEGAIKSHSIETQRSEWGKESTVTVLDLPLLKATTIYPILASFTFRVKGNSMILLKGRIGGL